MIEQNGGKRDPISSNKKDLKREKRKLRRIGSYSNGYIYTKLILKHEEQQ